MKTCLLTKSQFDEYQSNGKAPRCNSHKHEEDSKVAACMVGHGWRRVDIEGRSVLVEVVDPDAIRALEFEKALAPFVFRWTRVSGGAGIEKGLREGLRKGREA